MEDLIYAMLTQAAYDYMEESKLFSLYEKKYEEEKRNLTVQRIVNGYGSKEYNECRRHIESYQYKKEKHKSEIKSIEYFFRTSGFLEILNVDVDEIITSLKKRSMEEQYPHRTDSGYIRRTNRKLKKQWDAFIASSEF